MAVDPYQLLSSVFTREAKRAASGHSPYETPKFGIPLQAPDGWEYEWVRITGKGHVKRLAIQGKVPVMPSECPHLASRHGTARIVSFGLTLMKHKADAAQ